MKRPEGLCLDHESSLDWGNLKALAGAQAVPLPHLEPLWLLGAPCAWLRGGSWTSKDLEVQP